MRYTKGYREEIPDPTPVEVPLGYSAPEPLESMIARMIQRESMRAKEEGLETFEESDDFDVDDEDTELISEYQLNVMQEEVPHERGNQSQRRQERVERTTEERAGDDQSDTAEEAGEAEEKVVVPKAKKSLRKEKRPVAQD